MRLLEYLELDTSAVPAAYAKVVTAIERNDFKSADVRKLTNLGHGRLYRARLDDASRLLLTFVKRGTETFAVALEVILNHNYDGSRFVRGSRVDESRIPPATAADVTADAEPTRYVHPTHRTINLLDKPLSFDDAQQHLYQAPSPIVVVGSAGSGKTALALERLKRVAGDVLYVTKSSFLAQSARDMYFTWFDREDQNAAFLSVREFLESIHVPGGREATWSDFLAWFNRQRHPGIDAHQAFEEIRGVILANPEGVLSRADYLGLGIRQSIFLDERREGLYALFERYRAWLRESAMYDAGLVTLDYLERVRPVYDFMVIDEVQDLTAVQVALLLRALKRSGEFVLCGDSNQIVHPNFFSWGRLKTLLTRDLPGQRDIDISVLQSNYRSGVEATRVANTLLRIKQRRFGSIDRESNYLVVAVGDDAGSVTLLEDSDASKRQLNERTRASVRVAVLVLREEDKAEARTHFATPLIFSAQEAKGLEYDTVILFRFISTESAVYREICSGVTATDLAANDDLAYRRAADKSDKALEIYKFYVNALYVALTRARLNVVFVETQTTHPLLELLAMRASVIQPPAERSTKEDWQREARRLEQHGKVEQALAIRNTVLHEMKVPWPVLDEQRVRELITRVFVDNMPGEKPREQLREFTSWHRIIGVDGLPPADSSGRTFTPGASAKHLAEYAKKNFKDILFRCDQYGVEHRTPIGQTPLMAAATMGNVALIDALAARGADISASDTFGRSALHHCLRRAFQDREYANGPFAAVYQRVVPTHVDVMVDERLVRIDRSKSEFLLFQTMWALFDASINRPHRFTSWGYTAPMIEGHLQFLPEAVVPQRRRARVHVSAVLARNEIHRDYAYNRKLFLRIGNGRYQWNPSLQVRVRDGDWQPILASLNLPFMRELMALEDIPIADHLWVGSGLAPLAPPIRWRAAIERDARIQAEKDEQVRLQRERVQPHAPPSAARSSTSNDAPTSDRHLRWGTPEARAYAHAQLAAKIERLQADAAAQQKAAQPKADEGDEGGS